ncbi:MAG: hypothetical protein JWM92_81 [Candidatus Nomurabacteria bacterium]|jgi:hypothetical protein|nr:hypothetical protein [Candidatus Nomurabacteria bacterium]
MEDRIIIEKILELMCRMAGCTEPIELIGKTIEITVNYDNGKYATHITAIERISHSNKFDMWHDQFRIFFTTTPSLKNHISIVSPRFSLEKMPEKISDVQWWLCKLIPNTTSRMFMVHQEAPCIIKIPST